MKSLSRILSLSALLAMLLCLGVAAADGETPYDADYCFREADFAQDVPQPLAGIFVTAVPEDSLALVKLGSRTVRAGDILPAESLQQLRLCPKCTDSRDAVLCYQPIYGSTLGAPAQFTVRIRSGKNEAPTALDAELETYKNIPNDGQLCATDPEGGELSFALVQEPRRGTVTLQPDGSFVYTPNKNKVGQDSFTFTVTDDAGNTSQPATVRITIRKPTQTTGYTDLQDSPDQFEAMWLAEQGLGGGRQVGQALCFCPEESVSRGEMLVMLMEFSGCEKDGTQAVCCFSDCEQSWLSDYLTAALRNGIITGESGETGLVFRPDDPVTAEEAAVMLQNVLRLPVPAAGFDGSCADWAQDAVTALADGGIGLESVGSTPLTRLQAAKLLYAASAYFVD